MEKDKAGEKGEAAEEEKPASDEEKAAADEEESPKEAEAQAAAATEDQPEVIWAALPSPSCLNTSCEQMERDRFSGWGVEGP